MSENSPKILSVRLFGAVWKVSFSFTRNTARQCDTPRDTGHTARFWRLFHSVACNSFVHFSFRFIFSHFNKSNSRCVFSKTIILLGLESHSNKLHFPDKTKKGEMNFLPRTYKRKARAGSAHRDDWLTATAFSMRDLVLQIAARAKGMAHTPIPDIDFFLCTSADGQINAKTHIAARQPAHGHGHCIRERIPRSHYNLQIVVLGPKIHCECLAEAAIIIQQQFSLHIGFLSKKCSPLHLQFYIHSAGWGIFQILVFFIHTYFITTSPKRIFRGNYIKINKKLQYNIHKCNKTINRELKYNTLYIIHFERENECRC